MSFPTVLWLAFAALAALTIPMMYHDYTGKWPWQDGEEDDK